MRLKDKVAIITGSSHGIGKGIAEMFLEEGAKVVLTADKIEGLKKAKEEMSGEGREVVFEVADMKNEDEIKKMIKNTISNFGQIDILVNNAGLPMFKYAIDDRTEEMKKRFEDIMDVNFRGYWHAASLVVPIMKKQNSGSIINISSVRGYDALSNESAYCSAKGAVNMLTKSLAIELSPYNIRVNTISPGAIQVDRIGHWVLSRYGEKNYKEYKNKFKEIHLKGMKLNQPLRKIGKPKDIAYGAVYLGSEESRFVTGANLMIDGGLTSLLAEPPALDLKSLHDYYESSENMRKWFEDLE